MSRLPAVVIYYGNDPSSFSCPVCKAVYIGNGASALPVLTVMWRIRKTSAVCCA